LNEPVARWYVASNHACRVDLSVAVPGGSMAMVRRAVTLIGTNSQPSWPNWALPCAMRL
jgi:hypothetical protein